jgi:hypothetical protein
MDSCVLGSICFEMMKGVPAAFVTLIIGGIAGLITWRQYQVAKAKLKLDLFEKRYAIFHKIRVIISDVRSKGLEENYGRFPPFDHLRPETRFLFGEGMEQYLDELSTRWTELYGLRSEMVDVEGADRIKNIARASELENWFFEQASTGAKAKFSSYMNFENWK